MTGVWVTADTITAARMNEKTIIQGSGSTLNGLTTYAGMVAYCTSSGNGFLADMVYIRNAANTAWINEEVLMFGDGRDGSATNPALVGGDYKQYTDLTIDANTSWTGTGNIIVRVSGTFTVSSGFTLTLNNAGLSSSSCIGGTGGAAGGGGGIGGTGGSSKGTVIIFAKTTAGIGTITSTGNTGSNAGAVGADTTDANGVTGGSPNSESYTRFLGVRLTTPTGGLSGASGTGGTIGTDYGTNDDDYVISLSELFTGSLSHGGAGGGGGSDGSNIRGGGGGAGGGTPVAVGGAGKTGVLESAGNRSGGGGGGGGAPSFLILITNTITAISVTLTGGNGGLGTVGSNAAHGGGGGGAGAGWLLVAETDNTGGTLTGGTVGANYGTGGGNGTTRKVFITWANWITLIRRKL